MCIKSNYGNLQYIEKRCFDRCSVMCIVQEVLSVPPTVDVFAQLIPIQVIVDLTQILHAS